MRVAATLLLAVVSSSGCYLGFQRASWVTKTAAQSPDGDPSSDLSISADIYEVTGGVRYKGFDVFTGFGLGPQRVRQRRGDEAAESDEVPVEDRFHVGASWGVTLSDRLRLAAYGVYAGPLTSLLFNNDDLEDDDFVIESRIDRSLEAGLELSVAVGDDGFITPVLRVGYAWQTGKTQPDLYQSMDGTPDFDGNAIITTVGFNFGTSFVETDR